MTLCFSGCQEYRMMTGMHTVVDIYCVKFGSCVGWRYEVAFEKKQKYSVWGPDGNNYWVAQEVEAEESDTDHA
ncbi:unnamed protein product [Microthlaspi erraticum]|uniref:Yippee domain-containing protein n=1 Tax=Microthlaspi erraticum TaxID=1685480 RepID=A0A6D2HN31_9BRAS|nr:unnamed protein product [Microthlaspi erraticum]